MKEKTKVERRYLGTTVTAQNYRDILNKEGRDGINFHTKHLKAYLQGKTTFRHKFMRDEEGNIVTDAWGNPRYNEYRVQQQTIVVGSDEQLSSNRTDDEGEIESGSTGAMAD